MTEYILIDNSPAVVNLITIQERLVLKVLEIHERIFHFLLRNILIDRTVRDVGTGQTPTSIRLIENTSG
jgi:hypothetical protein